MIMIILFSFLKVVYGMTECKIIGFGFGDELSALPGTEVGI